MSCIAGDGGRGDSGDNWIVECQKGPWQRKDTVYLKHVDTGLYLHSNSQFRYRNPINGQQEVTGYRKDSDAQWVAAEGFYFPERPQLVMND